MTSKRAYSKIIRKKHWIRINDIPASGGRFDYYDN